LYIFAAEKLEVLMSQSSLAGWNSLIVEGLKIKE